MQDKRHEMKDDIRLKGFLVLQSFCPLFILLFIQHAGNVELISRFFRGLFSGEWSVFSKAVSNTAFGDAFISIVCVIWFLITVIVSIGFREFQRCTLDSKGFKISVIEEKNDSGVTFLVSFLLPLLDNDVSSLRGFLFFSMLLVMIIVLLMRSNLFYQNPVLVVLHYKTFVYKIMDAGDEELGKTYIGISKGTLPEGCIVKSKYIADGVYFVAKDIAKK